MVFSNFLLPCQNSPLHFFLKEYLVLILKHGAKTMFGVDERNNTSTIEAVTLPDVRPTSVQTLCTQASEYRLISTFMFIQ